MKADVVVVGAGPGGLSAAAASAASGMKTIVIEQGAEIGVPTRTTGGSFVDELVELGIPADLYNPIKRCRFVAPTESAEFTFDSAFPCVMDVRSVLQFLGTRAADSGAEILLATKAASPISEDGRVAGVKIESRITKESEIRCSVVIDASGYRSAMLKAAGVDPGFKRFGVGAEYDLYAPKYDQDEVLLIVGSQVAPSGYAWAFPWGHERVRVGVGVIRPHSMVNPDEYLSRLIGSAESFGMNLKGAQPIEFHSGLIPSDMGEHFVGDGIMAIGDAAGQASLMVGEGIRWAMKAGIMAGQIAAESIRAGDTSRLSLQRFERQWKRTYGTKLRLSYEINKKISEWDDSKWDKRTRLLRAFSGYQFSQALQANFTSGWALKLLWSNPTLMKAGLKEIAGKVGLRSASAEVLSR